MSSSTFGFDYGDDGADRRKLADGETNGDDHGTKTLPTPPHID